LWGTETPRQINPNMVAYTNWVSYGPVNYLNTTYYI